MAINVKPLTCIFSVYFLLGFSCKNVQGDNFDKYYASGVWMDKLQQEAPPVKEAPKAPLPETPPVDPKLVSQMVNTNVMQTGLTPTETALLSNEEKVIRLKQRGMAQ